MNDHEWVNDTAVNSILSLYCVNSFVVSINDDAIDGRCLDCRHWIDDDAVTHEIDNIDFTSCLNCDIIADVPRISSTFGIGIPLSSLIITKTQSIIPPDVIMTMNNERNERGCYDHDYQILI